MNTFESESTHDAGNGFDPDPVGLFEQFYKAERDAAANAFSSACCLSTVGTDGYPNARFVALKDVTGGRFIITGPLNSRKGLELEQHPAAALTFWWPATGIQVRIQGDVEMLPRSLAEKYFYERPVIAQILANVSRQGQPTDKPDDLREKVREYKTRFRGKHIPCPENWGGFALLPLRIEFLEFQESRLHRRRHFRRTGSTWVQSWLVP
jgi:pyridoxamine 5'-phosphate oxidase